MTEDDCPEVNEWLNQRNTSPSAHGGSEQTPSSPSTKKCPFCAETIQLEARKCRFCGEFLNGARRQRRVTSREVFISAPPQKVKDPGLAAVLSFIVPGLGQIYNGQIVMSILMLILCVLLYFTIVLGLLLHILLIYDAYRYASRLNERGDR